MRISVLIPLGPDGLMAHATIESVRDLADEIVVGWDLGGRTFSGQLLRADLGGLPNTREHGPPVRHVAAQFWTAGAPPLEVERRTRAAMAAIVRPGAWLFCLDADEVLVDAKGVKDWMLDEGPEDNLRIATTHVVKVIGNQAIVAVGADFGTLVGTKRNVEGWTFGRSSQSPYIDCPVGHVVHWTIGGRTEEEIRTKLTGWGHAGERDADKWIAWWRGLSIANHGQHTNCAPFGDGSAWPHLAAVPLEMLGAIP